MWHKLEVFVTIRHPFNLAWREFKQRNPQNEESQNSEDLMWHRHQSEIADEVVRHARIPSLSSRDMMEMAMQPWKHIHHTQDDGVENMSIEEIKRICLHWLEAKFK